MMARGSEKGRGGKSCQAFAGNAIKAMKYFLDQHVVIGDDDSFRLYRFWNHYFNQGDVAKIFGPVGFSKVESIKNLLTGSGPYNDHGVVFYAVSQ